MKILTTAALIALFSTPLAAQQFDYGFSGMTGKANQTDLPPLTLGSGKPLAEAPYMLKAGGYYSLPIVSDGTAEMAVSGGDFFRAIWVDEVVINDIEVRPMGLASLEFDDEGEAELSFIAIQPGTYTLSIPGSTGESQKATFTIQ